ncbi:Crp/Fnr family transcriptional regulator [Pseudorhodobacter sp. E13]|uniref:Crp/Fnr family transcriptional regulator n=1 Tax=Pseudorhodobacter sp. E13 TaxID=2487931 RepID=UPI000F8CB5B4|nr:Crp/Fnr family transcriptional regulator [Pseudorhodobacter sp. E13]RUS59094.1 Crp/Fnr family transcriptional regulator [Pseudorhodobacter sp. E13]
MGWAASSFPGLNAGDLARLEALPVADIPQGTAIFHPGETPQGFAVVLSGRIDVHLTGPTGREILLYAVEPGQSCVQTTLGLMGDEPYSGEAVAATACRIAMIPAPMFRRLMDEDAGFRHYVFRAFAQRMADMTHVLERVAFARVEARLAQALLDLAVDGAVTATQADLAARIGSAREVISRRLDGFARKGWVTTDRGRVQLTDSAALRRLAQTAM